MTREPPSYYLRSPATLSAGIATGRTANDLKLKGALVGVSYNVGAGDIKAGYAQSKVGTVERKRFGLGYHYNLSKRTMVYADVAHEREIAANKTGYDLGLIVRF